MHSELTGSLWASALQVKVQNTTDSNSGSRLTEELAVVLIDHAGINLRSAPVIVNSRWEESGIKIHEVLFFPFFLSFLFFFRMPFDANEIDWSSKVLKNDVFGVQRGHRDDNAKLL